MDIMKIYFIVFGILEANYCNSAHWYSATVIESEEPLGIAKDRVTNYIHNEKFLPISLKITDEELKKNYSLWHSKKRILSNEWKPSIVADKPENYFSNVDTRVKTRKKCSMVPRAKHATTNKTRTRFLEVFEVVEFDHVTCTSSSGLEGSCLHEAECETAGGTTMGSCADGYGTCCVSLLGCDSQSAAAIGWFTNPDFPLPSTERLSCVVSLSKFSADVTQIRLDFTSFELLPPSEGICQLDRFVISGQNINNIVPILCGINTGQHVYVEVGDSEGPIYLTIQTETAENRIFSIKVTQLTPSDELTARPGCLQYFTEPKGYLESFNYRDESEIAIPRAASYLNNLNYAICIKRAPGTCSVTYTAGYIQIVNYDTDGLPVLPPGQAGVEIFNCPSDWLLISATRLCGDRLNDGSVIQDFALNAPVTDSSAGPIVLWFRSDEGYVARGFRLQYEENPCPGPT